MLRQPRLAPGDGEDAHVGAERLLFPGLATVPDAERWHLALWVGGDSVDEGG